MKYRKESGKLKKLFLGATLRCPNCEVGSVSDGLFSIRPTCPNCQVRFERKQGESTGASIIWISFLPISALILFFTMYFVNPTLPIWLLVTVPLGFVTIIGVLFYRNARGLWIAMTYLAGGVYADEEAPVRPPNRPYR